MKIWIKRTVLEGIEFTFAEGTDEAECRRLLKRYIDGHGTQGALLFVDEVDVEDETWDLESIEIVED